MTKVVLAGRTDLNDYFKTSGVFQVSRLTQTPFLVYLASDETVQVVIVESASELLDYPDDTPVMGQWRGEWRSDFFQFTVGRYREFAEKRYEPLKSAVDVVKTVGPQGGLRCLSFSYDDENGVKIHTSVSNRDEVARLEAFFAKNNISIEIQRKMRI